MALEVIEKVETTSATIIIIVKVGSLHFWI